jgi:hypothetical protein
MAIRNSQRLHVFAFVYFWVWGKQVDHGPFSLVIFSYPLEDAMTCSWGCIPLFQFPPFVAQWLLGKALWQTDTNEVSWLL